MYMVIAIMATMDGRVVLLTTGMPLIKLSWNDILVKSIHTCTKLGPSQYLEITHTSPKTWYLVNISNLHELNHFWATFELNSHT
jgi:hypothetical protein